MNWNRLRNRFWRRYEMITGRSYERFRLAALPKTLEYRGEFGLELLTFLPFVRWLSANGHLKHRSVITYKGMRSFYQDLAYQQLIERDESREFIPPSERPSYLPIRDEFTLTSPSPFHSYPDLRKMFGHIRLVNRLEESLQTRPLLIIHNKYTNEWNKGPINFIDLETLNKILGVLKRHFHVVYIRHGLRELPTDYAEDQNDIVDFDDLKVLRSHPEVELFDDLLGEHQQTLGSISVNEFKNALCSRSFHFISSQGGGAHHLAYFSGSVMVILHREGLEENGAYETGFYRFISNPAPILLCCRNGEEVLSACKTLEFYTISQGRVVMTEGARSISTRFSPNNLPSRNLD